jgi:cation transport protein ChaC
LCIYSHVHRGTPENPGLVLGLARGGACRGIALRVTADSREATIDYLRERELVTSVYREIFVNVRLLDGRRVRAICYVVDVTHAQFAGRLPREELLRLVRQGAGRSGHNIEYVLNTHEHLKSLGLRGGELEWIARRISGATSDQQKAILNEAISARS